MAVSAVAAKLPLINKIGIIFLTHRRNYQRGFVPHNITLKQFFVLKQLVKTDFLNPSQIAEMLFCDRPTATVIIKNLERQGWIRREKDPENGKQVRIFITDGGREKLSAVTPAERADQKDPFECLTEEERDLLEKLITKVYRNLKRK
jgi:DNA-binding MarR family transcriptional regulator